MRKILILLLLFFVSSCETMSEEEKKLELDKMYLSVKSLPSSKPPVTRGCPLCVLS